MKLFTRSALFLTVFIFGFASLDAQTTSRERKVGGQEKDQVRQLENPKFRDVVEQRLAGFFVQDASSGKVINRKVELKNICPIDTNLAARRVFYDYGAIFIADKSVQFPTKCIFSNEREVRIYQNAANPVTRTIGGVSITLQESAMNALLEARQEARRAGLSITPRGGTISGKRSFNDTLRLWNSRFYPALNYWTRRKRISRRAAEEAKGMSIEDQVAQVLKWEQKGIYFSTRFDKSILYSVAAPGASQHIFMLALDVKQFANKRVRDILAKHHWYQTVKSDLPHFTYLGVEKDKLRELGLKPSRSGRYTFWIPNE